jgi:OmpA-OmpF porin, OOP family
MNTRIAIAAALGLAASAPAFAQSENTWNPMSPNFHSYIGASGGRSDFRTDCPSAFDCDKKDTGWKAYFGGKVNDIIGMELAYTDFGKIRAGGGDVDAWAGSLSLTAGVPIGDRFSIFAKGGGVYGRTDIDAPPSTLFDTGHKNGWGWTYGAGAALGVTQAVQIRLDWDRYKLDFVGGSRDVDLLSAGVQVRF